MGLAASRKIIQPGQRIRVLVVDDSAAIRRLVTRALERDPLIEVAGTAANGSIALTRVPQVRPDVITLDIEMPGMSGLEMLRELRKTDRDIRVIMFSALTGRGAASTLEALLLGADDYVTKAPDARGEGQPVDALRCDLIPKIKQFFSVELAVNPQAPLRQAAAPRRAMAASAVAPRTVAPRAVALGVSTGGPAALARILPCLPADFPLPVLIVQHMPPLFTRLLAERLQVPCRMRVVEAEDGMQVTPGRIYIAPGDRHMRVQRNGSLIHIALDQAPPENSCRPSVDVLFRSMQEIYGAGVVSVILTGMGYDGLRGAEVLKAHGAYVIAQDEASSVVWGMPGAVVAAGLADVVAPLDHVPREILAKALT